MAILRTVTVTKQFDNQNIWLLIQFIHWVMCRPAVGDETSHVNEGTAESGQTMCPLLARNGDEKKPVEEKRNATLEEVRQIQKWFRVPNMAIVVTMKGFKSNSSTSRRVVFVFQLSHLQNFMTLNKGECIFLSRFKASLMAFLFWVGFYSQNNKKLG